MYSLSVSTVCTLRSHIQLSITGHTLFNGSRVLGAGGPDEFPHAFLLQSQAIVTGRIWLGKLLLDVREKEII